MSSILESAARGYSCLASWAGLLDRINVFPVADGDTGTNLRISLAPLCSQELIHADLPELLARAAVGNSGNIAAAFFREFLRVKNPRHLAEMARAGQKKAEQAVLDPRKGTMLDVFVTLSNSLAATTCPLAAVEYLPLCGQLQNSVLATSELLPELREAGVVDAGALAMFIFFEGFFKALTGVPGTTSSIMRLFGNKLVLDHSWQPSVADSHCIDALLHPRQDTPLPSREEFAVLGDSVVVNPQEAGIKIHLHTENPEQIREKLAEMGRVEHWKDDDMAGQSLAGSNTGQQVHIMTDAAGSLDLKLAKELGITLLDSFIISGDRSTPESLCNQEEIYALLKNGSRVTTAQASDFERHQHYASTLQQFSHVIYLAAGSAYTGNFAAASAWKRQHDTEGKFTVLDSGAASGRLGLMALRTARFAQKNTDPEEVAAFAIRQSAICCEYVFIDSLKYLAAGGRISRTKSFFGEFFRMKPVISPLAEGVAKKGVVRSRREQLAFACARVEQEASAESLLLLQYSDNKKWVEDVAVAALQKLRVKSSIIQLPLSLTSGVHMGPGTWAMAFVGKE